MRVFDITVCNSFARQRTCFCQLGALVDAQRAFDAIADSCDFQYVAGIAYAVACKVQLQLAAFIRSLNLAVQLPFAVVVRFGKL